MQQNSIKTHNIECYKNILFLLCDYETSLVFWLSRSMFIIRTN